MVVKAVSKTFTKIFGSRNERLIKAYTKRVEQINAIEQEVRQLSDAQLRNKTVEFREQIAGGERMAAIMPQVMAVGREVMDRSVGIRNIFNPEHNFDASLLPENLRGEYDRINAEAQALEPANVPGSAQIINDWMSRSDISLDDFRVPAPGWMQVEIPVALYDAVRELYPQSRPPFRTRPFDVQLIGGMVLGEGRIAEMKTGEGKTIVAPLACYVASIENLQCHVVTVNDYLVQRDRDWVYPFYYWLGLTVGAIHPMHTQPGEIKAEAYNCDVVYGTNSEFGFDYLRDNMKTLASEQVQRRRDFCIIDEVDSILVDEARTPLIISGPAHDDAPRYSMADGIARHLMQKQRDWNAADAKVQQATMRLKGLEGDIRNARDKAKTAAMREEMEKLEKQLPELEAARDQHKQYYELEPEKKASHLTHDGIAEAQHVAGIGSFYVGNNMDVPHLLENALRAHVVYQRDKDYVVQDGEVVIVDEFTGRLMIGRQWSDGLHQAVEAKERVKIKQETQTLATVTIQNFFKLYQRLAGMTGTAITEATEFNEIYKLDVVCIPTNVPVVRDDRDDLIFLSEKDKWDAILDEIKRYHEIGRPVLVGTTSVERSEMLSKLLTKKHGIPHDVLNAKQHEREANIVETAGALGAVVIATNMAGRGTDIKLAKIDRATIVHHWQQRNLLPKEASADMDDDKLIELAYRHIATWTLGMRAKEVEPLTYDDVQLRLLRHWACEYAWLEEEKAERMDKDALLARLDKQGAGFMLHRLVVFTHIEKLGGLHIVGTERHEARRIDNQLRGRAGRQGDNGSSRFFISLEDDLMKMFAGKTTLTALSKLGMKEGDAIEHKWITKSVERAQRKVEERNYEIRKNLLEYDEVMEHQRNDFYSTRQTVLEGLDVSRLLFDYIGDAVDDAVALYLDPGYVREQIAEWCRQTLDVSVDPAKLNTDSMRELEETIRKEAQVEARQIIDITLGEYMPGDSSPEEWDLRGLSSWAMSRFNVDLKQNQLRRMSPQEVQTELSEAAAVQIDRQELLGLQKFGDPLYAQRDLVAWCEQQFNVKLSPEDFVEVETQAAVDRILDSARQAYTKREQEYPIEFALDMAHSIAQSDPDVALQQLLAWAQQRYDVDWTIDQIKDKTVGELEKDLRAAAQPWLTNGKLDAVVDTGLSQHEEPEALANWAGERFGERVAPEDLADAEQRRAVLLEAGRAMLRRELTQLEQFVLLQILDSTWKEHLYAMDQLKDAVSLHAYAEKDPRIEYKREGSGQYLQMQKTVRDRVTELIFRARLTPDVEQRNVYGRQEASHDNADSALAGGHQRGTAEQRADREAADLAGSRGDGDAQLSRRERRARRSTGRDDSAGAGAGAAGGGQRKRSGKQRKRKRR